MKTVLIPVDGSPTGLQVVKTVLAAAHGGIDRIHLLNVQPRFTRHASRYLPRRNARRLARGAGARGAGTRPPAGGFGGRGLRARTPASARPRRSSPTPRGCWA